MRKSQKVNFLLEKEVTEELQKLVPAGQRSKVVNLALKKELQRLKRKQATEKLLELRQQGRKINMAEIVEILRTTREKQ